MGTNNTEPAASTISHFCSMHIPQIPQIPVVNLPMPTKIPTIPTVTPTPIPIPTLFHTPAVQPSPTTVQPPPITVELEQQAMHFDDMTSDDVTSNNDIIAQPVIPAPNNDRKRKIARWLEKRKRRTWAKRGTKANVNRKAVAMKRRRVEGRFAKKSSWVSCA